MPLSLRRGRVTAIVEELPELVRCEVDGVPCIAYPRLTGPVEEGDEVIVNVKARELGLGSGGFDILYANLTRGLDLAAEPGAHVMKLPYTPLQLAARHVEEDDEPVGLLERMPVVCCSLHSQLAPVCAALDWLRVAYVQLEGGALPLALSDTVRALETRGLLGGTATVGACFGGEAECVTPWSALAWAKETGHDVAVCAIGPGIVGTASRIGHGGLAAATAANAATALGGLPVVAARISEADPRERHRGVSHHTIAVLDLCLGEVLVADDSHAEGWQEACAGLPLEHMGRGPDEDPAFFSAAFAAGRLARGLVV